MCKICKNEIYRNNFYKQYMKSFYENICRFFFILQVISQTFRSLNRMKENCGLTVSQAGWRLCRCISSVELLCRLQEVFFALQVEIHRIQLTVLQSSLKAMNTHCFGFSLAPFLIKSVEVFTSAFISAAVPAVTSWKKTLKWFVIGLPPNKY